MKTIKLSDKAKYYLSFGDMRHFWKQLFLDNDVDHEIGDDMSSCMLCGCEYEDMSSRWKHAMDECPWGIVSCGGDDVAFRCGGGAAPPSLVDSSRRRR